MPAARRGPPRWTVALGLVFYCAICWAVVVVAAQTAFEQFAPPQALAQDHQAAGGDNIARR